MNWKVTLFQQNIKNILLPSESHLDVNYSVFHMVYLDIMYF
jgi:hypothetical protein